MEETSERDATKHLLRSDEEVKEGEYSDTLDTPVAEGETTQTSLDTTAQKGKTPPEKNVIQHTPKAIGFTGRTVRRKSKEGKNSEESKNSKKIISGLPKGTGTETVESPFAGFELGVSAKTLVKKETTEGSLTKGSIGNKLGPNVTNIQRSFPTKKAASEVKISHAGEGLKKTHTFNKSETRKDTFNRSSNKLSTSKEKKKDTNQPHGGTKRLQEEEKRDKSKDEIDLVREANQPGSPPKLPSAENSALEAPSDTPKAVMEEKAINKSGVSTDIEMEKSGDSQDKNQDETNKTFVKDSNDSGTPKRDELDSGICLEKSPEEEESVNVVSDRIVLQNSDKVKEPDEIGTLIDITGNEENHNEHSESAAEVINFNKNVDNLTGNNRKDVLTLPCELQDIKTYPEEITDCPTPISSSNSENLPEDGVDIELISITSDNQVNKNDYNDEETQTEGFEQVYDQVKDLKQIIDKFKQDNTQLISENQILQAARDQMLIQMRITEGENEKLVENMQELKADIMNQNVKMNKEKEECVNAMQLVNESLKSLHNQFENVSKEKGKIEERCLELQIKLIEKDKIFESVKEKYSDITENLKVKISQLESKLVCVNEITEQQRKERDDINEDKKRLEESNEILKRNCEVALLERDKQSTDLTIERNENQTLRDDITSLEDIVARYQNDLENVSADMFSHINEHKSLLKENESLERRLKRRTAERDLMDSSLQQIQVENSALLAKLGSMKRSFDKPLKEIELLRNENIELKNTVHNLQKELDVSNINCARKVALVAELDKKLKDIEMSDKKLEGELKEERQNEMRLKQHIEKLQNRNIALQSDLDDLRKDTKEFHVMKDKLQDIEASHHKVLDEKRRLMNSLSERTNEMNIHMRVRTELQNKVEYLESLLRREEERIKTLEGWMDEIYENTEFRMLLNDKGTAKKVSFLPDIHDGKRNIEHAYHK